MQPAAPACSLGSLPSVQFKSGSASLSTTAKSLLDNVAQQLMANPNCKVKLVGYGASDKRAQQLSWDHVNAIKTYLTEKQGISETRVIFTYGMEGTGTTVDLVPTLKKVQIQFLLLIQILEKDNILNKKFKKAVEISTAFLL